MCWPTRRVAQPQVVLMSSGSEVALIIDGAARTGGEGRSARVVSMPSHELFAKQPAEYQRVGAAART